MGENSVIINKVIALAGNPNVGKSTVFNGLTGLNQHTGNWPGKTVENAQGYCSSEKNNYTLVDIPGTYSLMAHSAEEEVARNFICFGEHDGVVIICDATCLERNLNLVLQILEITSRVIVCVNLLDEARRKNIKVDLKDLENKLGVPVIGVVAKDKKSITQIPKVLDNMDEYKTYKPFRIAYSTPIEEAITILEPIVKNKVKNINTRWLSLKLLDYDKPLMDEINAYLSEDILLDKEVADKLDEARLKLLEYDITSENLEEIIVSCIVEEAEEISQSVVEYDKGTYNQFDRRMDKILTGKKTGYFVMIGLLALVFWITIVGSNYPSEMIATGLFWVQDRLTDFFMFLNAPEWLHGVLVLGVYRVLAWVVSVMLPPMAIFFPLFMLLEDVGYLPRIAYNMDKSFKKCCACGKQALTMCMGFGCNAAGVTGARIIDSPRERLIAIITNNFVPCNGRFPILIAIITIFFAGMGDGILSSIVSAILLTLVIVLGVAMTLIMSKFLSHTFLKGEPSSFTLELPPYRKPRIGNVIIRSIIDRTLFVLLRAVTVAAPAGLIIWIFANVTIGDISILNHCTSFLDPFAQLLGLDGVILMAFILGIPANEIVIPIMLMAYLAQGSLLEVDITTLKQILLDNGWTWVTAICVMLFTLFHWPCGTTLLTIKKETGSFKWTALSFILPTLCGFIVCFVFANIARLF